MTWAKTEVAKRMSNLGAQAVTETLVGCKGELVIRLKGGKYSSTGKPLSERVFNDVN